MIKQLKTQRKQITLQWIPAHCGIHGNEEVDILAEEGSEMLAMPGRSTPILSAKCLIKLSFNQKHTLWIKEESKYKNGKA